MKSIQPTPSQAAIVLKKFLAQLGYELKLHTTQEAVARTRGYESFQAFVAAVHHRGTKPEKTKPLTSAAGNELWALSGRLTGDDDDTMELIWAKDLADATHKFNLAICNYSDLDASVADQVDIEEDETIYLVSSTRVGTLVQGQFHLNPAYLPPAA